MFVIFDELKLFLCLLTFRIICLCLVHSYFVPDEYWQSLEIAHSYVFGYGYVTWEWDEGIRSFFYPFWIALSYKILSTLGLDYAEILILLPRLIQSVVSAVADLYYWLWLKKIISKSSNKEKQLHRTYFLWVMCLILNYCSSRTLTNVMELNFSTIALYYYPWYPKINQRKLHFLWFVGFACLTRPTAALQWLPLCVFDLISNPNPVRYIRVYLKIIFLIICLSLGVDFLYYKRFILTSFNFILYNGQYNIGIHYGSHSWFWYIVFGIPIILGPSFLFLYYETFSIFKYVILRNFKRRIVDVVCSDIFSVNEFLLCGTFIWTVFLYSIIPHKEFRFILPLAPIMFYLAGSSLHKNFSIIKEIYISFFTVSVIICNILGLLYLGLWHQVGSMAAISKLANIALNDPVNSNYLFLTPCHATPLYSHLHVNISTRFLTCEPNLRNEYNYKDEAEMFFHNPIKWLDENFPEDDICLLPSHIVYFSDVKPLIRRFLDKYNYTVIESFFHTHVSLGRQSQFIEIAERIKDKNCL